MSKTTAQFIIAAGRAIGVVADERPTTETPLEREVAILRWQFDAQRREIAELHRQIEAAPPKDWLTVREAAAEVNRTEKCIRWRCLHKSLGSKIGGRYRIDRDQLRRAFLAGI